MKKQTCTHRRWNWASRRENDRRAADDDSCQALGDRFLSCPPGSENDVGSGRFFTSRLDEEQIREEVAGRILSEANEIPVKLSKALIIW